MSEGTDQFIGSIHAALRLAEAELGLPEDFLAHLLVEEDDWSFVIKLHALIEASATHHLTTATDKRLHRTFERMDMGDSRAGKMVFARALELWTSADQAFVQKLSELRNRLVHDPRNVTFRLSEYVKGMDPKQATAFKTTVAYFVTTKSNRLLKK